MIFYILSLFRKRYFIFSGDFQLRYFTSSALDQYKGSADLTPSNVVSVDIENEVASTEDVAAGFGFVILCKDRRWKFRARTARERQQWVDMLRSVVMLSLSTYILL